MPASCCGKASTQPGMITKTSQQAAAVVGRFDRQFGLFRKDVELAHAQMSQLLWRGAPAAVPAVASVGGTANEEHDPIRNNLALTKCRCYDCGAVLRTLPAVGRRCRLSLLSSNSS